jgi:hypothetical protein
MIPLRILEMIRLVDAARLECAHPLTTGVFILQTTTEIQTIEPPDTTIRAHEVTSEERGERQ